MVKTVGIADMALSRNGDTLVTHALGSCLGVTIHDPVAGVGGLIHIMLPQSKIDPAKARQKPCMFVDTGVPRLFERAYGLGATKENVTLKVAGGAQLLDDQGRFKIGERNFGMLRKLLWKNNILIAAHDVGGGISRTMSLEVPTGTVRIKNSGGEKEL